MSTRSQTAVANEPTPGSCVQQSEAVRNSRKETSHEAANAGRREDLPLLLPCICRRRGFVPFAEAPPNSSTSRLVLFALLSSSECIIPIVARQRSNQTTRMPVDTVDLNCGSQETSILIATLFSPPPPRLAVRSEP